MTNKKQSGRLSELKLGPSSAPLLNQHLEVIADPLEHWFNALLRSKLNLETSAAPSEKAE